MRRFLLLAAGAVALGLAAGAGAEEGARDRNGNPNDWLLNAPDDRARFELLQRYLRGFDQPMWEVGERFQSIYDAIGDENYELAAYHWEKIRATIVNGYMKRPKRKPNAEALFVNGAYEPVLEGLRSNDRVKAWDAFALAHRTCQACHQAEGVAFINNQPLFRRTARKPEGALP
ncbi:MAG: hypothetical protein ACK4TP_04245 [Hyphomicrobium sp.]